MTDAAPGASPAYDVNSPRVIGGTVDDETVLIDSRTGAYYGLNESASHLWSALRDGPATVEELAEGMARLYGLEVDQARSLTTELVAELAGHELLRPAERGRGALVIEPLVPGPMTFAPPRVERFDDLEDLLLLDPIHDVDPGEGWPIARPDG